MSQPTEEGHRQSARALTSEGREAPGRPRCGPGLAGPASAGRGAVAGTRLLQQSFRSRVPAQPLLTLLFPCSLALPPSRSLGSMLDPPF